LSDEGEYYAISMETLFNDIQATLDGLSDDAANWRPEADPTNSMYVIIAHIIGSTGRWLKKNVAGLEDNSDREAEFRSSGPIAPLVDGLKTAAAESRALLEGIPAEEFGAPRRFVLGGQQCEWPVRQCVLHVIEHLGTHLGHLQLTRQLVELEARKR
jgi:hypothetical protein